MSSKQQRSKGPPRPITEADVEAYLVSASDFRFEMFVLNALETYGFSCEHGGTYVDPISNRGRQFDIRARRQIPGFAGTLLLAIECKNLSEFAPLLSHRVPRKPQESTHDLVRHDEFLGPGGIRGFDVHSRSPSLVYPSQRPVSKRLDQVKRRDDGSFAVDDSEFFDKAMQAINSANGLIQEAAQPGQRGAFAIFPMLVVPDDRLWVQDYSADGDRIGPPCLMPSDTLFVGRDWPLSVPGRGGSFRLSHLEIVTASVMAHKVSALGHDAMRAS
jgi:hypothetical protein